MKLPFSPKKKVFRIVLQEIWLHRRGIGGVILIMLASISFQALTPWPFKFLLDNVLGGEAPEKGSVAALLTGLFGSKATLGVFAVSLFFFSNILASLMDYWQSIATAKLVKKAVWRFSQTAFENLASFDIGHFVKKEIGDYIYRLSYDVSALGSLLETGILPLMTASLYFVLIAVILVSINPLLAVLSLSIMPFFGLNLLAINRRLTKAGQRAERRYSSLFSFVQQSLSQLKVIQAYRREKSQLGRYREKIAESLESDYQVSRFNFLLSLAVGISVGVSYSLIVGVGVRQVLAGQVTPGLLVVYILYLDHLTGPVLNIIDALASIRQDIIRLDRLGELFDERTKIRDTGRLTKFKDYGIRLVGVSLKGAQGKEILKDVSCEMQAGKLTAILGMSGAGKSTLTALVTRLIAEPAGGKILIGGREAREYRLTALREAMALVPQEVSLFNDSIREIISFGKEDCRFEEIKVAARMAAADDFIRRKPRGYDYRVGEGGVLLSGGQRQRLALARAYVRKAPILVLDEVFSSQDDATRHKMLTNLREFAKGRTVVLVTNTKEVLQNDDRVIYIVNGRVHFEGTYAEFKGREVKKNGNTSQESVQGFTRKEIAE